MFEAYDNKNQGPMVTYDKNYLCMMTQVCKISQDQVKLKNTGSTTVTYEWKKIERGDYIQSKNSDGIQRFYCHYPRDILKPGESKTFIFSFRSEKPGIFNEEWELLTEPQLLEAAQILNLSGMATKSDNYVEKRNNLNSQFEKELVNQNSANIVEEIVGEVKTPPIKQRTSAEISQDFEKINEHLGLKYTPSNYQNFVSLYKLVVNRLKIQKSQEPIEQFKGEVEYIEELITRIHNPYTQKYIQKKYVEYFYAARKLPVDRAQSYNIIKDFVKSIASEVIDIDDTVRREMGLMENQAFEPVPENQTEQEAQAIIEEMKLKKAEAAKKSKQKPKTEEEEAAEIETLIKKSIQTHSDNIVKNEQRIKNAEKEMNLIKTRWLMENHIIMNSDQYDCINRKLSIYDIELGAKDIILRLDLDIPLSKFTAPPKVLDIISAGKSLQDGAAGGSVGKDSKGKDKNSDAGSAVSISPLGEEEHYWKTRQILDHSWVKKTVLELRMCMERMVNRVFIIGNLGQKAGHIKGENSMKIIQNVLQQHIDDVPIHFLSLSNMHDFQERKAMDEFADNCIYVVENLNFNPEEFGTYEPKEEGEGNKGKDQGKHEDAKEEEAVQTNAKPLSREAPSRKNASRPNIGTDKASQLQAVTASQVLSSHHDNDIIKQDEDEIPDIDQKDAPFTIHTIHQYKKNLGQLGEIYVNDAPLASLSNSNTVNDISCKQKVMGMKMTEGLRNIAQFFMKQFPLDINSIYVKKPDRKLEYFRCKSSAIIGGICKSQNEILEKIVLANSFMDTFEKIYLVGELGLVALYALGLNPGHTERSQSQNIEEYKVLKEFIIKLFERSILKDCQIILPQDVICCEKKALEEIIPKQNNAASKVTQGMNQKESQENTYSKQSLENIKQIEGMSDIQKEDQNILLSDMQSAFSIFSGFKPTHWTDAQLYYGYFKTIDLTSQISKNFAKVTEQTRLSHIQDNSQIKGSESGVSALIQKNNPDVSMGSLNSQQEPPKEAAKQDESDKVQANIPEKNYVLAYGPKTMRSLKQAVNQSFKLFWDGSISMFQDTVLSSQNNKEILNTLLEMRTRTNEDEEPPVTLLHGQETEKLLRQTLMRIKIEQQEALEAKRKAAEEQHAQEEEDEMEMADNEAMDLGDESEEKITTFQEDLDIITDFSCFTSSEFTMKIMQGVNLKCMQNFGEHKKPSREQEQENMKILEDI